MRARPKILGARLAMRGGIARGLAAQSPETGRRSVSGRIIRFLALFALGVSFSAVEARSWRDLDEGEHEIYGREREEKLPIRMFFIQKEKWENHESFHALWLYGYTDYPRYRSSRLLPFYYSLSAKHDNRYLFLSPVYYREIDGSENDQSLLWLYYWGSGGSSGRNYSVFFPLYYNTLNDQGDRLLVSPLFMYSSAGSQQNGGEKDTVLGIPLVPLILWKSGEEKRDLTLFYFFRQRSLRDSTLSYTIPFYYYDAAKDGSSVFFLSPVYYRERQGTAHDTAVLWLFYMGSNGDGGKNYSGLLPVYYHSQRADRERFFATPLFVYSRETQPAKDAHATERSSSFFISPLYANETTGQRSNSTVLYLFYWGGDQSSAASYTGLFPLYYRSKRGDDESFFISPLFWHSQKPQTVGAEGGAQNTDRFFLSPLYMNSSGAGYNHTALFWLWYYGHNDDHQTRYRLLFPLFYYATKNADDKFLLTPLFWYARNTAESDFNVLYLIRHRRQKDDLLTYALPFYYYSREGNESWASYLIPFVWVHNTAQSSTWLILPFFYSAEVGKTSTKLSPLYISLSGENSNFRLFLPLYLNYNTADYSFHINLTGISLSEEKLTHLPVSAELSREKIMVDWDLGWFYNLFRVSSRDTIRLQDRPAAPAPPPPEQKPAVTKTRAKTAAKGKKPVTAENPPVVQNIAREEKARLIRKRERTRADSENFFGLYFLFGVSAYEKSDHYRHFRLLPLSWLTWNAQNNQGVQTIIPFYVKYEDEDTRYLVFFPVYGTQQKFHRLPEPGKTATTNALAQCTDEISSWLIIAYWNEFDCESKISEQTILWPIYNRYTSPQFGGFRIFPVFWSKRRQVNGRETASHFSPLHYTSIEGENFNTQSWFFYRRRTDVENIWGVWALLHLNRYHDGSQATTYILPFYYQRTDSQRKLRLNQKEETVKRHETLFTFAAVFWRFHSSEREDEFTGHFSPLYVYLADQGRDHFYSWLYYYTDSPSGTSFGVPLILHRRRLKNDQYANFYLIPFYHSRQKYAENNTEYLTWLFPLFYHRTSATSDSFVMPLFYRYAHKTNTPVTVEGDAATATTETYSEVGHISPLYYYHQHNQTSSFYSWIFYRFSSEHDTTFGVPLLLHRRARHDGNYGNFYIPLFYRSHETFARGGSEGVTWLFPVFYLRSAEHDSVFVMPFFYRHRWQTAERVSIGAATNEISSSPEFATRHVSPLYVYNGTSDTSSFTSWLFYRYDTPHHLSYGIPLVFHRKAFRDNSYANFYLFPFYYSTQTLAPEMGGEETVSMLLPLWYRRANDNSHVRFIAGYYHESSPGYRKDMIPLIAGRTYNESLGTYSWNALLYTFWYERTKSSTEFRLLYGIGFNYTDEEHAFSWHIALASGYKHVPRSGYVRHHLLPLWWHSHTGDDSDLYLPFLLAAFRNHDNGNSIFRAVLLGLLYYENSDLRAYDQTLGVLLGSLYYHNKYPDRKFDSYGSLYGLLWHYETEENYKRFSFLTFIYTRTETEKGTRHRLLGIPL